TSAQRMPENMANGERSGAAPVWTEAAPPELAVSVLLDIGSDDGVPVLGDHVLGRRLLIEGREHGLGVERRVGELGQEVSRDGVPACEVVEADRVAIAGEPQQLSLVGVEILLPERGGVEVRL